MEMVEDRKGSLEKMVLVGVGTVCERSWKMSQ